MGMNITAYIRLVGLGNSVDVSIAFPLVMFLLRFRQRFGQYFGRYLFPLRFRCASVCPMEVIWKLPQSFQVPLSTYGKPPLRMSANLCRMELHQSNQSIK